jgi:hypothetical protein
MALVFDHVESQLLNTLSRPYLVSLLSSASAAFDATYLEKHFYCKYKSLDRLQFDIHIKTDGTESCLCG